jgi:hypothetical protein
MKTLKKTILLLWLVCPSAHAQLIPNLEDADLFRETGITAGYALNAGLNGDIGTNHVLELGLKGAHFVKFIQTASINYYAANEFVFGESFSLGPKVGAYAGFSFFVIGTDLTFYTNFADGSLRLMPYGGIGNQSFRLVFSPHISLINDEFQQVNPFHIALVIRIFRFNRDRIRE